MIDTHSHMYLSEDFPDGEGIAAVKRALESGVSRMIFPGVDVASLSPMLELYSHFPDCTAYALGLHPSEVDKDWRENLDIIFEGIDSPGVVAVGEVGMDFHEDRSYRDEQREAFAAQVAAAHHSSLPLIIHQREALDETLGVLAEAAAEGVAAPGMVFHCFTGSKEDVRRIREVVPETYFGIGGVATFKNAPALREALHEIGIERIVLETDAPWLAPVPMRGRRDESAYIPYIAQVVADTLGISVKEVSAITDGNARKLFPRLP